MTQFNNILLTRTMLFNNLLFPRVATNSKGLPVCRSDTR